MLVDAVTGEIKHIKFLGLSERFTKKLYGTVMELKVKEFDKNSYIAALNSIFTSYDTKHKC